MHFAVAKCTLEMVKYLVEKGADVNDTDTCGSTVLHTAVTEGTLEIVKYLVVKGADVNGKKKKGLTVLHSAVTEGKLEIVKYLVEKGADVNGKKKTGGLFCTLLLLKLSLKYLKQILVVVQCCTLPLLKSVDVNAKDTDGWTVLHSAVTEGTLEIVKYLVQKGADLNGKKTNGSTVLHSAVAKGNLEIVKYLVEHDGDVNGRDTDGWTVLHSAITDGTLEIVKFLVEKGADINGKNTNGWTVLHSAVTEGALEIIKCLVEKGADVNGKDTNGCTVLHSAVAKGRVEIVKYLVENGAEIRNDTLGIDILKIAIVKNSVNLVTLLLKKNVNLWRGGTFLVDGRNLSLLEMSIHLGHDEIATILKRSVKHRQKIQVLGTTNCNQLEKTEIPIQAFVADKQFRIGDGGYSCVYVGLMKDGSEVAVKRMVLQKWDKVAENEMEIMSLLKTENSPFIVSYRYFHRDENFIHLIVDLCEETLTELVGSHTIEQLQEQGPRMIKEILSGLEFLHGKGILHRDLKPSNILVDIEGSMRLADFGISRILKGDETAVATDAKGTEGWIPPEVIEAGEKQEKGPFKKKSDVHVAGMIAFYVLTKGEHPFGSRLDRTKNVLKGNSVNLKKLGDRKARKFVSQLINHKIDKRPYADEALRDSFVNED
ncbi:uncharacterized protein LOC114519378 [Dendronephthya gigantea]|uniref:uncharacterized protein LOC114519378 n=1 Tax=Dendronephthya gigantea TaxID=151771 RepID=UPI001069EC19|nr:uncharacterized protein LOC114519378 [Dendronephthya gigantea]